MKLAGKRALVTQGNYGIGQAAARLFLQEGAEVAITGTDQKTLDEALELLGSGAVGFCVDVSDSAPRRELFTQLEQRFGSLDIIFANASVGGHTTAGETSVEFFESILRVNLTGAFFTVEDALHLLNDGASIIFNGSVIGSLGLAGYAAYSASKGGLRALARSLTADLSPRGIRVNVVSAGATNAPAWSRYPDPSEESKAKAKRVASTIPLGRWGQAEEVAKAVLFLASDDSAYVQATELFVDGGLAGAPFGGTALRALVK
jgi:NAD(P)-dependent dehydrogenase (short-subunit alcohol dehydrogenase family)